MQAGMGAAGLEQQLPAAPEGQEDLVPGGLVDLLDTGVHGGLELLDDAAKAKGV